MQRPNFTFHKEWRDAAVDLPVDIRAEIYEAIIEYALTGEIPAGMKPIASAAFKFVKERIDSDAERYNALCERNRINGSKSKGRPKIREIEKTQENPTKPKKPSGLSGLFKEEVSPTPPIEEYNIDSSLSSESSSETSSDSEVSRVCETVFEFYNKTVKNTLVSKCVALTEQRKKAIKARVKEFGIDQVYEAITKVASSSFCNGHNDRNWTANFDFVFNANKMAKTLEGKYDNKTAIIQNLTEDDKEFFDWMKKEFPRLSEMKSPLTRLQFIELQNMGYSSDLIVGKLNYMENRSDIYKYVSTFELLKEWLK